MIFKDYYKILGLDTSKATNEEVKQAYREQAKKYHPDINSGNRFSEERFKDINEAYRILSDTNSRRRYDRQWNSHIGKRKKQNEENKKENGSPVSEFLGMFFGEKEETPQVKNRKKVPVKGENIETEIEVSVAEAFYGATKKISLRTVEGKMKTFEVTIPTGIRNNEKIRLIGQGKEGQNGGSNGDLFIKINIKNDKIYRLNGIDLYTDLKLTPWEAALGAKVDINSIDETISLCVPQGIQSGEKIKIANKGYKDGKGGRGDLVAEVKIMVPKTLNEGEKSLFEEFNKISNYNPRAV